MMWTRGSYNTLAKFFFKYHPSIETHHANDK
jgi:hypothetical protein